METIATIQLDNDEGYGRLYWETDMKEKRKPGPKPRAAEDVGQVGSIRLTPARWARLRELGVEWLNRKIDEATGAPPASDGCE